MSLSAHVVSVWPEAKRGILVLSLGHPRYQQQSLDWLGRGGTVTNMPAVPSLPATVVGLAGSLMDRDGHASSAVVTSNSRWTGWVVVGP